MKRVLIHVEFLRSKEDKTAMLAEDTTEALQNYLRGLPKHKRDDITNLRVIASITQKEGE